MGRNWTKRNGTSGKAGQPGAASQTAPMQLCLFRLDGSGLRVESCAILDNADEKNVTDGYYAMGIFRGAGRDLRFHVITYRGLDRSPPDLIQLEFRWSDLE